ncbi:MAG TPA: DedA family protein [Vicinamibacterales bacterium]|nr:DedA family protein [Vicinamibacterales bacterium]
MRYGYLMVAAGVIFEGDATLATASFLAHRGYLNLYVVMLVAGAASVVINQTYFWIGRKQGLKRLDRAGTRPFLKNVLVWARKRGVWLTLTSRFVFGIRIAISMACGAAGMSPLTYFLSDIAGAVIWSLSIGFFGYAIGEFAHLIGADLKRYEWWVVAILISLIGLGEWYRQRITSRPIKLFQ